MIKMKSFFQFFLPPLFLLGFAAALRINTFGNPMLDWDEQYYLFGGGRLLHGDIPYVDFWDRKPVGLFLIYGFFHLFGPYRIVAYQTGALLALWATALLIRRMARIIAPPGGAFMAAVIYEIWPILARGESGQSPIFYNLPVAGAMALIMTHIADLRTTDTAYRRKIGTLAMLLFGLAIQIKYTVIFEGIFAGVYLLYFSITSRDGLYRTMLNALVWISVALAPTVAVYLFYAVIGHGHEWIYANILSVFGRTPESAQVLLHRVYRILLLIAPFAAAILLRRALRIPQPHDRAAEIGFLNMWTVVSIAAVAVFGTWYIHYVLPVFVPLSIETAPLFCKGTGKVMLYLMCGTGIIWGQFMIARHLGSEGNSALFHTLEKQVAYGRDGCFFIYKGPVSLYDDLPYCHLTDHPFPSHFSLEKEAQSTGMDPVKEMGAVLSQKPAYIITGGEEVPGENRAVRAALYDALTRQYTMIYGWTPKHASSNDRVTVYKRVD
ncbi:hypothetical protein KSAC_31190 (plasmid) [Komagataeibacter saccharivorans]|nr:hypothetical protein KSAC_31190 [Komagataeibacter saccharivorans]